MGWIIMFSSYRRVDAQLTEQQHDTLLAKIQYDHEHIVSLSITDFFSNHLVIDFTKIDSHDQGTNLSLGS